MNLNNFGVGVPYRQRKSLEQHAEVHTMVTLGLQKKCDIALFVRYCAILYDIALMLYDIVRYIAI